MAEEFFERRKTFTLVRAMGLVVIAGLLAGASSLSMAVAPAHADLMARAEAQPNIQLRTPAPGCYEKPFFLDVGKSQGFFGAINAMACEGVATGMAARGGRVFAPKEAVTREAMAAFIYRRGIAADHLFGYPFETPAESPFADVRPGDKFYREITWLHHKGITTGTPQKNGKPLFQPKTSITREAMAAFLYRYDYTEGGYWGGNTYDRVPKDSPFEDMTTESRFYREIAYVGSQGEARGFKTQTGREFRPKESVTREAMAAFIMRLKPLDSGKVL